MALFEGRLMTGAPAPSDTWQQLSLQGLVSLRLEAMPAFEVLFLDDIAGYLMGSGPLAPPYTVEHGSRVVSALFGAVLNSGHYVPAAAPVPTPEIATAREHLVQGAHDFGARGLAGLTQLVNRIVPAVLGELEMHKEAPEQQTCSLFYYSLLAVASGPANTLAEDAAAGVMHLFRAWDEVFGQGFMVPWRRAVPNAT
jgi:hypothetical protein